MQTDIIGFVSMRHSLIGCFACHTNHSASKCIFTFTHITPVQKPSCSRPENLSFTELMPFQFTLPGAQEFKVECAIKVCNQKKNQTNKQNHTHTHMCNLGRVLGGKWKGKKENMSWWTLVKGSISQNTHSSQKNEGWFGSIKQGGLKAAGSSEAGRMRCTIDLEMTFTLIWSPTGLCWERAAENFFESYSSSRDYDADKKGKGKSMLNTSYS